MSATLGATARAHWTDKSLPDHETASTTPYPAVWINGENVPRAPMEAGRPRTVHPETVPTMEPAEAANRAISAAEQGARVLVIRNTVGMAVATWRAVIDAGAASLLMQVAGGPALHHGRFAVEDRALLDRSVEDALRSGRGTGVAWLHRDRHADPGAIPRHRRRSADYRSLPDGRAAAAYRPTASARTAAAGGIRDRTGGGVGAGKRTGSAYGAGVRQWTWRVEDGRWGVQRDLLRPRGIGADSTTAHRKSGVANPRR